MTVLLFHESFRGLEKLNKKIAGFFRGKAVWVMAVG